MNKLSIFSLVLVSTIMIALLLGCTKKTKTVSEDQEFIFAYTSDVRGLSPFRFNDGASFSIMSQIYETLLVRDWNTKKIEPLLAESYKALDEVTWEFKIRQDVFFHDGTRLNAQAVKYTLDKVKDPEQSIRASLLVGVADIIVIDDTTIHIKTKGPYPRLIPNLTHYSASIVSPKADSEGDINKNPVGTGPFILDQRVQGDYTSLVANPDYWAGEVRLKRAKLKVVPDLFTALALLESGEIHFINKVLPRFIPRIKQTNGIHLKIGEGTRIAFLAFNQSRPPFSNPLFRQAFVQGVDISSYINTTQGLEKQSKSIIAKNLFGYHPSIEQAGFSYNPEESSRLVQENGFSTQNFTITAPTSSSYTYREAAVIIQAQLKERGFSVNLEIMDYATSLEKSKTGDFDVYISGWTTLTGDSDDTLFSLLHSSSIGGNNRSSYLNPAFDAALEKAGSSFDEAEHLSHLREANEIAVNETALFILAHSQVPSARHISVKNLEVYPTTFWSMRHVFLEEQ